MQVTGTVIVNDTQKGTSASGREWQKKTIVVEYMEGTFTKRLAVELFGEERIKDNPCRKGQTVTIQFDVESNEWNGRWFTACKAWRVEPFDARNGAQPGVTPSADPSPTTTVNPLSETEALPF